jgi:hypothetical protein
MSQILDHPRWPTIPLAFCAVHQAVRKWEKAGRSYLTQRNKPPAKKPTKKRKASLDIILSTVERGFAAVAEDIADIKNKMATKDNLAAVETRLDRRIDKLDAKFDRVDTKLTKFEEHEIDKRLQLEVRVSNIEKHLGLDKKIAA